MAESHDPWDDPKDPRPKPGGDDPPPGSDPSELDPIEFLVGRGRAGNALTVTVANGRIGRAYGPAELIGRLAERIAALVKDVAGSETMLYAIAPTNSMTFYFDDPPLDGPQGELPIGSTHDAATQVGDLIETTDDEFFARALRIGAPMRRYDELAQLVENESLTLRWHPRDREPRELTPELAGRQHRRLQAPVETEEWDTTVNGILYRVIADPGAEVGAAGIHLFNWSEPPPGVTAKAIAPATRDLLDAALEAGLFGKPVQAKIRLRRAKINQSIDPKVEKEWVEIKPGPDESSAFGVSLEDLLRDDEPD